MSKKRKRKSLCGTEKKWIKIYRESARLEQKSRCYYCGEPLMSITTTADHIRARSKGGPSSRENIKATCAPCNTTKSNLSEIAYKRLIKNPQKHHPISVWLAWSRRKIWKATHRSCERIRNYVA